MAFTGKNEILGTLHYMSPQVEVKETVERYDICVLHGAGGGKVENR
jgi:hypothetical protein